MIEKIRKYFENWGWVRVIDNRFPGKIIVKLLVINMDEILGLGTIEAAAEEIEKELGVKFVGLHYDRRDMFNIITIEFKGDVHEE